MNGCLFFDGVGSMELKGESRKVSAFRLRCRVMQAMGHAADATRTVR